jgi:hypothetical protein
LLSCVIASALSLLSPQVPGDGWVYFAQEPPRQVKRVYWDLFQTTEVWVRIMPEEPDGSPPLVDLVFQAFFPGRAERDPYTGLPRWPKGAPARLAIRASLPTRSVREESLQLAIDGETFEVGSGCTSPSASALPCQVLQPDGGFPVGMTADVEPTLFERLAGAKSVTGTVLGFPITLSADDRAALVRFVEAIHLKAIPAAVKVPPSKETN